MVKLYKDECDMTNKEFIQELSKRLKKSSPETQQLVQSFVTEMTKEIRSENSTLMIQGFGTFEVKKKMERVIVNPAFERPMLVPPKLNLVFHPSNKLKEFFK
jgi:DNA-binding protein HU-beta